MSRENGMKRGIVGLLYVPAHYFVIYPAIVTIGIALGIVNILHNIARDEDEQRSSKITTVLWDRASKNMKWILTGNGEFKLKLHD